MRNIDDTRMTTTLIIFERHTHQVLQSQRTQAKQGILKAAEAQLAEVEQPRVQKLLHRRHKILRMWK
jgi:hypothetical protein